MFTFVVSNSLGFENFQPNAAVESQQIAADGVEMHPEPRVDAPFQPVGPVELLAAFAVETDDGPFHVAEQAMFVGQIAIAAQGDIFPFDGHDTMQHEVPRLNLCQDGIAHFRMGGAGEQRLVAVVFQKGRML